MAFFPIAVEAAHLTRSSRQRRHLPLVERDKEQRRVPQVTTAAQSLCGKKWGKFAAAIGWYVSICVIHDVRFGNSSHSRFYYRERVLCRR
jgi:hypothetical protein